ncbi:MAG: ABC transporter ATP-binding protein [Pseudomonadota bacterium]
MNQPTMMVELRDLTRRFDGTSGGTSGAKSGGAPHGTLAVDRASLRLPRGDFLTILGPSGCGKTTLLRMIAGFLAPSSGAVAIDGKPMAAVPPHRRAIGMVFQRLALFPHMTAAQNIAYPLRMRGFAKAKIPERVRQMLRLVRLEGLDDRRPDALSGGQQQRVAIARALSFDPDLLLLDEPLSALDRKLREEMQLEFRRIQRELGVTTINVTHDQREALVMSDRILVMESGRIQQDATPEAVYQAPANRFVAGFLGMTSILPGTFTGASLRIGTTELPGRPGPGLSAGAPAEAAIRAERIRILAPGETAEISLEAVVDQRVFEGDRVLYELRVPSLNARLAAFDPAGRPPHGPGETLRIGLAAQDIMIFPGPTTNASTEEKPT